MHLGYVARRALPEFSKTIRIAVVISVLVCGARLSPAQQKGQWVPGQFGLNAGAVPEPGLTEPINSGWIQTSSCLSRKASF